MDGNLVPGGPVTTFLKIADNRPEDFRSKLKEWNPGAIALFLAEFAYQETHDSTLYAAVETVLHGNDEHSNDEHSNDEHSNDEQSKYSYSSVEHGHCDNDKGDLGEVQHSPGKARDDRRQRGREHALSLPATACGLASCILRSLR